MNKDNKSINLSMLADYYEFTMANGYIANGVADTEAVFDMFFRKVPDNGGFAIAAGLEQVIEYIENLKFTEDDIDYFKSKKNILRRIFGLFKKFQIHLRCMGRRRGNASISKGTHHHSQGSS